MAEYAITPLSQPYDKTEAPMLRMLPPMPEIEQGIEYQKPVPRNPLQTHRAIGRWAFGAMGVTGAVFTTFAGMNWAEGSTIVPYAWQIAAFSETTAVTGMFASPFARNWRELGRIIR
jgi:hypothetical protein